jgi:hypothetical protein
MIECIYAHKHTRCIRYLLYLCTDENLEYTALFRTTSVLYSCVFKGKNCALSKKKSKKRNGQICWNKLSILYVQLDWTGPVTVEVSGQAVDAAGPTCVTSPNGPDTSWRPTSSAMQRRLGWLRRAYLEPEHDWDVGRRRRHIDGGS